MTPDTWVKLQAYFEEAISLDEPERSEYLLKIAANEADIAEDLRRLLAEDEKDDNAILEPVAEAAATLGRESKDPWIGKQFGSYTATRKIATGGMSAVYLGIRDDKEFEQKVAIKIVANHFASPELNTRFRVERQILASLHHANIAELYDGGTTDEGMPFLIMEYIDGSPIDEYCDKNILNIDQRLELFTQVTAAVEYAHKNLIVHRDIKPSNIIVTTDGVPKLLDFGIAKPLERAQFSQTIAVTRADMRAMTPEYASPEQVRGEAITTATDVYSLGVLLYKLLSGRMPYLLGSASVAAVAEAICETVPSRPSTVVNTKTEGKNDAPKIVALRGTSLSKLQRTLSGDLDNIVLATLQKDPDRRYPSARALRDDIQRYRSNEPITARPDSIAYRVRKFASRHSLGVATSIAGFVLVVSLVSFYTWQVTNERNRAEAQARKAEQVVDFLSGVFVSVSPFETQGIEPTVRDVLQRGTDSIDQSLADQPEILSDLLRRLGIIHDDLGYLPEAESLIERSIAIQREIYGENDPRIAGTYLARASAHRSAGEFEQALELAESALSIALAESPPNDRLIASSYHLVGNTLANLGDQTASIEANEKALQIFARLSPEEDDEYALVLNDIAYSYMNQDEFDIALRMGTEAYERKIDVFGRNHPAVAVNLSMLARINQMLGNLNTAEQLLRETLELEEQLYGREHAGYGVSLTRLAGFLSAVQRWEETESLLLEAVPILEKTLGPNHYRTSEAYVSLGEVYSETGRHEQALELAEDGLQRAIASNGPRGWRTAIGYAEYADALLEASRDVEAVATFRQSVSIFEDNDGGLATAYTQAKMARALLAIGAVDEAAELAAVAEVTGRSRAPPENSMLSRILVASSEIALAENRLDDARRTATEAIASLGADTENLTVWYWLARLVIAGVDSAEGNFDLARQQTEAIVEGLKRDNGTRSRAENSARELLSQLNQ